MMEETNPKTDEIQILEESNQSQDTAQEFKEKFKLLQNLFFVSKKGKGTSFTNCHFSLLKIAHYTRLNIKDFVKSSNRWSPEDIFAFGEYVIFIIAKADLNHYILMNNHEKGTVLGTTEKAINNCSAKEYLCSYVDAKLIAGIVRQYFQSGFYRVKNRK